MDDIDILITKCDFKSIFLICENIEVANEVAHKIFKIGVIDENITAYACSCYLAENSTDCKIKATFHNTASMILTNGFAYLSGSYALACSHLLKAIEYDPECVEYKKAILLTFSDIPDFSFEPAMQKKIAVDIIRLNPFDDVAQKYLGE